MKKRKVLLVSCLMVYLLLIRCGTTAIISKRDGGPLEGTIIGNDTENVYIQTMGKPLPIKKSEITDIDHPGNGALITGISLFAYGIANIAVGTQNCGTQGSAYCVGVFTPAAVGLGLGIWGYVVWTGSVSNANDPGKTVITATIQPMRIQPLPQETVYYSELVFHY